MDQKRFRRILKKYLRGQATAEEERTINSWYTEMGKDAPSFSNNREEVELEKRLWSGIGRLIRKKKNSRTYLQKILAFFWRNGAHPFDFALILLFGQLLSMRKIFIHFNIMPVKNST